MTDQPLKRGLYHANDAIYCVFCGKKLEKDRRITSYDKFTGKPVRGDINTLVCFNIGCKVCCKLI